MVRGLLHNLARLVSDFLNSPARVLFICFIMLLVSLLFDGSLFRLWRLHRDSRDLNVRIENMHESNSELDLKIKRADDPYFIELQAREKFDLAQQGDLIFVFSDGK